MYKMTFFIIIFFQILLYGCIKNSCTDDSNPDCPNYNPCKKSIETTASFKIYDRLSGISPIGWVWQDTDTVSIGAIFEADMPYKADGSISYEWHIGAGIYYSKLVEIPDGMPLNQNLSAMLIVRNSKLDKSCFPLDDGVDTFIRNYYTSDSYKRLNGVYRGAYSSKPFDSFDFLLNIDSSLISLPYKNCTNFIGIDEINNGTISFFLSSFPNTISECRVDSRVTFTIDKNSKCFCLKLLKNQKLSDSLIKGIKIKSL